MNILNYIDERFNFLINKYKFIKTNEEFYEENFIVKYHSNLFCLKIQNYFREIYSYASPPNAPDNESAIYNIIIFQNNLTKLDWNYFHEIEDLNESFRKQIDFTSEIMKNNFDKIRDFYKPEGFEKRYNELRDFVINLYPETFKMRKEK